MANFLYLLALVANFTIVCKDDFHGEVGEAPEHPMRYRVLSSAAGYYLGYTCPVCGPYDRCTWYFETREQAEAFLRDELEDYLDYLRHRD